MSDSRFAEHVSQHLADFRHEVAKLDMPEESWDSLVGLTGLLEKEIVVSHNNLATMEQTKKFIDDHFKVIEVQMGR
jgi:hypothetical protein